MNKIVQAITPLAEQACREAGATLWDVEYIKEAGHWFLRVYIDKADGVSIEDCEAVSRILDPVLDEGDFIPGQYTFEVSSAGAERQLKRERDFAQFYGRFVEVKLYRPIEGSKEHIGTLAGYDQGDVIIEVGDKVKRFKKDDIAVTRLRIV
ncbi:MAG: ribosome maturation factor RimP [Oscillospiraceae bacterium]|nr:ribosome maturation factor RimP [Oscillospiraceae bacterium]